MGIVCHGFQGFGGCISQAQGGTTMACFKTGEMVLSQSWTHPGDRAAACWLEALVLLGNENDSMQCRDYELPSQV